MTPEQRAARDKWKDGLVKAENAYARELESYNDGIREARKVYDKAVAAIEFEYYSTLKKLDGDGETVQPAKGDGQ